MSVEAPFRTQLTVTGMTCQHCVLSVTEEVSGVEGVGGVDVELEPGARTVLADRAVGRDEIEGAVTTAGFALRD